MLMKLDRCNSVESVAIWGYLCSFHREPDSFPTSALLSHSWAINKPTGVPWKLEAQILANQKTVSRLGTITVRWSRPFESWQKTEFYQRNSPLNKFTPPAVISNRTPHLLQASNFCRPFVNTIISVAQKNNSLSAITVSALWGSVGVSPGLQAKWVFMDI